MQVCTRKTDSTTVNLIGPSIDRCFSTPFTDQLRRFQHLAELLADTDIFVVSVTCPLIELRRRERLRGDRTIGEAEYHLKTYNYAPADIEVDSSLPGRQCCDDVLNAWRARTKPSMFSKNWHLV